MLGVQNQAQKSIHKGLMKFMLRPERSEEVPLGRRTAMARLEDHQTTKLDARIAVLRQEVLRAERTLAREIKKRELPCRCQRGENEYTQEDFEKFRDIFETARTCWLAEHTIEADTIEVDNA